MRKVVNSDQRLPPTSSRRCARAGCSTPRSISSSTTCRRCAPRWPRRTRRCRPGAKSRPRTIFGERPSQKRVRRFLPAIFSVRLASQHRADRKRDAKGSGDRRRGHRASDTGSFPSPPATGTANFRIEKMMRPKHDATKADQSVRPSIRAPWHFVDARAYAITAVSARDVAMETPMSSKQSREQVSKQLDPDVLEVEASG